MEKKDWDMQCKRACKKSLVGLLLSYSLLVEIDDADFIEHRLGSCYGDQINWNDD